MNGRPVTSESASAAQIFVRGGFARFTLVPSFTSGRLYTYSG